MREGDERILLGRSLSIAEIPEPLGRLVGAEVIKLYGKARGSRIGEIT